MPVFLFAGDRDVCAPGIEAFIDQFATSDDAMARAEHDAFDWAQIVSYEDVGLKVINVGKYSERKGQMLWIRDEREPIVKHSEAEYRQIIAILKVTLDAGIVLFSEIKAPLQGQNGYPHLVAEMLATSETVRDKLLKANMIDLEVMATCVKDVINRAYMLARNPIDEPKYEQLRIQWVAGVKSLMKEIEWIRPVPKRMKHG